MPVGRVQPTPGAERAAVETNLAVKTDLGEGRSVLHVGGVTTQPKIEADEQVRADEGDELGDAIDGFLQFVGLGVVVARLQRLGAERAEQQGKEQIENDQVADDHSQQEEWNADQRRTVQTVPHGLDPLAAQHAEDYHERVQEVGEIPARLLGEMFGRVVDAEQLLAHHGEDEDNDCQDEAQVAQRAHRASNDADEQVQSGPRLGQLEHS